MSPPAWRKDEGRKAVRDENARRNAEAAKEAQRRADEARRKTEQEEEEDA